MTTSAADQQFKNLRYRVSELEHRYGPNVHILSDVFLLSHLARLCSDETTQPMINELVTTLYSSVLKTVVNAEFPTEQVSLKTRMAQYHPNEAVFQGPVINPQTPVVSV